MPDLLWTEYTYAKGHATVITHTGLQDILDLLVKDTHDTRILAHTLHTMTERNKRALAQQMQDTLLQVRWATTDQQRIADYSNAQKYTLFDVKPHYFDANDLATRLDAKNGNHNHAKKLLDIRDMQKPFYRPIADSKSARVFGSALQFLQSDIEKSYILNG